MKEFFYIATDFPSEEGHCIDGYRREIFSSVEAAEDFIQKKYPKAKKASEDEENDRILYCVIKLTLVE